MNHRNNLIFLYFIQTIIFAQPELRFLPFDWVQYRQTGKVNSISFSDRFAYIATEYGGLQRFNLFSNRFDEPITMAQGLQSNTITATHRSSNGVLWVATPLGIEYSFNEEGDWRFINRESLTLPYGVKIERIGESSQDIWLDTPTLVYRLDPITGVVTGVMANPDVPVVWSSGLLRFQTDLSNIFIDYSILNGWMTDLRTLFNPNGKNMRITTMAKNKINELWFGTEDGTFFRGDNSMRTFTPYQFSLGTNNIKDLEGKDSFWIGGVEDISTLGISYFDAERNIADNFYFDENINMDRLSVYSIINLKNEIWFGSEDAILVYNIDKDFWRTFNLNFGGNKSWVTSFLNVKDQVWIGTPNGLLVLDKWSKNAVNVGLEKYFKNIFVYDISLDLDQIFIATDNGIFIYDLKNKKLYDLKSFGYKSKDFIFPMSHFNFTALTKDKDNIYFANATGIISFNFNERTWSNIVNPSIFGGQEIISMAVSNQILFISTVNGLVKYDIRENLLETFNYPFLGRVNDMYIKGRKIWLGTSEGLVSYRFR